ncbi:MAG: hypothetical protein KF760_16540 [Candidatus Eremiobacteraeota bacterium]|nr:hypothetical protein [Candidatus Eremiobacteraeota bacterium]MCW5867609.1 hypothetical protein [Candidatus Eremiobacteraeota bacterium]
MAGISGFGFNTQFNFQTSFASSFATNNVPYTGSNFGAFQIQQTAGFALGALGQLQGSYLDILGGNSLFPSQPAPFASFNNVFVPSGASPFASGGNSLFPSQPAPFASFNNVFVPSGASPFASFNNVFVGNAAPFASFNNVFVPSGASPFASFNNTFVPPGASPFASFGGTFPGQPLFGQGTGAIALFPATQFIPFG